MSLIADIHNDIENGAIRLITEYQARLFSDAIKICGNSADAEDLVNRTFVKAINSLSQHKPEKNFYGWMKAILVNLHRDDLDRPVTRGTEPFESGALEQYAGADWSTDEEILRNSDCEVLREVLQRLDPKEREILLMRYYDGFSLKEIANVLNMPVSTVGRRIHLAMRLLAGKLGTKMGKKPLAVLGALLFGVTALFGAYQTGLIDAVVEKWHGSTDAVAEERGCGILPASGQDEQSAFVPAHPQAPDNASDEQFDLTQEEEAQTQGEQEKENTMNIGQKAVVGLATAVSAVLPLTTEATPCLNLPTEWLGQATTTKGDGVSFSGNFTDVTSALTISFWVKNPTTRSQSGDIKYGYVIGNGCYSGKRGFAVAYQEQVESGRTVKGFFLQVKDNTGGAGANAMLVQRVVTCNDVQDGNWHHIVVVYDATEKALVGYYDGVAQDSSGLLSGWPVSANNASLVNTLSIGRNAEQGGWALGGEIAEVSLWNRALTEEEIAAVHGAPIINPASQTGLLGYWQFHDGQGATASDASVHGSMGTIKDRDDRPCTSDWGGDFDVYKNVVTASITGFVGLEDGNGHACSCTNVSPADCTVRWAWNGDLENFVHDAPEVFTDVGLYTNACRVTKENFRPFEVQATVDIRSKAFVCLKLPTEWLGQATTTKGDGVSFSGNFTDVTSALTISFWVKNPTTRSQSGAIKYGYVIGNGCYSGKRGFAVAYQEQVESGQTVKGFFLQVRDNTGETGANAMLVQRVVTCNDVQDGNWHHIVVVYDATEKALVGYYDGVAQDSSGLLSGWPVSANNASLVNTLSIGRNAEQGGWALGGEIAEVSLWNRALTEEEVAAVHGAPIIKPASQTGLLGYWQFHDGQGATASDASVHGSIGTIKDGDDQPCTSDWGGDFDVYKNVVTASITGFVGLEDGNGHACSCTNVSPADCTVRWAWNGDLENFVHDAPEVFTDVGLYTNACRVTKENCRPFEGQATVDIRPVLYVATNGDDLASGKIRSPLKTVTEAIERMGSRGGRVYLNDGVYMLEKKFDTWPYTETVDYTCGWCVQVRAPIEIIGLSQNPKKVVLDAKGAKCALMAIRHPGASLRYLTLQNANADERGPAGSYGGGNLRLDAGSVSDCIFRNGFLHTGAGANLWASTGAGRVSRCAFYGGASGDSGVASVFAIGGLSTAPILDNCLIYGGGSEEVQNNAMVMARGGAKFVNCTISGARGVGAAARTYDKSSLFVNCAIYDNDGETCSGEMSGFRTCATADAISGGMDCKVIDEPKFKNAAKGDYRLTADSPLIGAGNVQSYHDFAVSETDLARKERIRKNAISIGCYEFVQNGLMLMVW